MDGKTTEKLTGVLYDPCEPSLTDEKWIEILVFGLLSSGSCGGEDNLAEQLLPTPPPNTTKPNTLPASNRIIPHPLRPPSKTVRAG